jgi:hypothetical protein
MTDVSVDCGGLKVLCFERGGLELVSVDFNMVKVFCFDTLPRISGSADSKEVSNETKGLGGFGFSFTWKITIKVSICQGNSRTALKRKEIGARGERLEGVDLVLITALAGKGIPYLADGALEFGWFGAGGVRSVGG